MRLAADSGRAEQPRNAAIFNVQARVFVQCPSELAGKGLTARKKKLPQTFLASRPQLSCVGPCNIWREFEKQTMRNTLIFAGNSCPVLTKQICENLGMQPADAELTQFSNVSSPGLLPPPRQQRG